MSIAIVAVCRRFRRVMSMSSWGRRPKKRKNVSNAIGAIFEQPWSGHGRGALKTAKSDRVPIIFAVFCHHQKQTTSILVGGASWWETPLYTLAVRTGGNESGAVVESRWSQLPSTTHTCIRNRATGIWGFSMACSPLIRANTQCLILEALSHCSSLASLAVRRRNGVIFSFAGTRMTAFSHLCKDAEVFGEQEPSQEAVGPSSGVQMHPGSYSYCGTMYRRSQSQEYSK